MSVSLGHCNAAGWFIDAAISKTITAGTNYTMLLTLDSAPVSGLPTVTVVLNGRSVLSYSYNIQFVGGVNQGDLQLGLLARYGVASFYGLTIRGDDPAYARGGTPQLAIAPTPVPPTVAPLTPAELSPIVTAAIYRWAASPALHGDVFALRQATVAIATLPNLMIGQTIGDSIVIDPTAAGWGWFIDVTPLNDSEFSG